MGSSIDAFAATAAGDWRTARELLETSKDRSAEALEALAQACWWLNDPKGAIDAWERAYTARLDAHDKRGACRTAILVAREYAISLGNDAATNGWLQRAAEALQGEGPCPELGWIAICEALRATSPSDALAEAERALELSRRFSDRELEIYALAQAGIARVQLGRVDRGMDDFDSALAAATGSPSSDPRVLGDVFCGLVEACMTAADMSRTEQWLDVFNDYMTRHRHPPLLTFCSVCDAEMLIAEGRWTEAETTLRSSLEVLAGGIRRSRCVHPAALLAEIRVDQSRFEEADQLVEGLEDLPEMALPRARLFLARGEPSVAAAILHHRLKVVGTETMLASPLLEVLVQAEIAQADATAARKATLQLDAIAASSGRTQDRALADLSLGRLERAEGLDARDRLEAAREAFASKGMPLEVARARLELALLARDQGDRDLAVEEAKISLSVFEKIGSVRDADMASRLLRDMGASGRVGQKGLRTLTVREREVLALLGQGLTNAEIAARLFISTKTAGNHVSNILWKLGMHNRAEAGAYAQRFLAER